MGRRIPMASVADLISRIEIMGIWLEMLTGAISIDLNLNNERKFNLLKGECNLQITGLLVGLSGPIARNLPQQIVTAFSRSNWNYRKIGDVGGAPNYEYTQTTWVPTADSTITMAGSGNIGEDWVTWLQN